jgi:ABC-2 type transport system ATP-binding protein
MIHTSGLTKHYRVHERETGLWASLRSVFRRRYREVRAVEALSFSIAAGERVGFLGPNGAGKTTTLKMLAGLLHPTAGEVEVAGFTPRHRETEFLKSVTLVAGQRQQLLWDLPPADTFALNRAIYEIPKARFDETLAELVSLLSLGDLIRKPTRQLSLGERMKCELAAALLHRPKVCFLDEPTIGLDVSMQAATRAFIRAYNERFGATVLLTSHYMDDVAALCPRVIVIGAGRLLYDGALAELVRRVRPDKRIIVRVARPITRADADAIGPVVSLTDAELVVQVGAARLQDAVARVLATLPVSDLTVEDPPLEEVMQEIFSSDRPGDTPSDAQTLAAPDDGPARARPDRQRAAEAE